MINPASERITFNEGFDLAGSDLSYPAAVRTRCSDPTPQQLRCGHRCDINARAQPPKGNLGVTHLAAPTQLGYLGLGVSDLAAWHRYATTILGLEVLPTEPDGSLLLRMDEHQYRFILEPSAADDLNLIGWEVRDEASLAALTSRLQANGIAVKAVTIMVRQEAVIVSVDGKDFVAWKAEWDKISLPAANALGDDKAIGFMLYHYGSYKISRIVLTSGSK